MISRIQSRIQRIKLLSYQESRIVVISRIVMISRRVLISKRVMIPRMWKWEHLQITNVVHFPLHIQKILWSYSLCQYLSHYVDISFYQYLFLSNLYNLNVQFSVRYKIKISKLFSGTCMSRPGESDYSQIPIIHVFLLWALKLGVNLKCFIHLRFKIRGV